MSSDDTRQALLDAAEALFADEGYAATSLRQLTARANANLAAVNYHFGSKEDLARAVLAHRAGPINAERLRLLEALEASPEPPTAREVLRAFVQPVMQQGTRRETCRMFGRMLAEQPPFLREFLREQFSALGRRFVAALGRALPELAPEEIWWRLHFTLGALVHTLQHSEQWVDFAAGDCAPIAVDALTDRLIDYVTAGTSAAVRTPRSGAGGTRRGGRR